MLAGDQADYVSERFGVYDHYWQYYANFLGEPFLLADLLVYTDGQMLYICAYPLRDVRISVSQSVLQDLLFHPLFSTVRGVNIWGRFDVPQVLNLPSGARAELVEYADYPEHGCDVFVDLDAFDPAQDASRDAPRALTPERASRARLPNRAELRRDTSRL